MSAARVWVERLAQFEESGGAFMLALESGDETFRFALSPHIARRLCEHWSRALDGWERERRTVCAFPARAAAE